MTIHDVPLRHSRQSRAIEVLAELLKRRPDFKQSITEIRTSLVFDGRLRRGGPGVEPRQRRSVAATREATAKRACREVTAPPISSPRADASDVSRAARITCTSGNARPQHSPASSASGAGQILRGYFTGAADERRGNRTAPQR